METVKSIVPSSTPVAKEIPVKTAPATKTEFVDGKYTDFDELKPVIDALLTDESAKKAPSKIQRMGQKFDSLGNWQNSNIILFPGELAISFELNDENKISSMGLKAGDGKNRWSNLPWIGQAEINSISDIGDVTITNPENGQVLTYDSTTNTWKNTTITQGESDGKTSKEISFKSLFETVENGGLGYTEQGIGGTGMGWLKSDTFKTAKEGECPGTTTDFSIPAGTSYDYIFDKIFNGENIGLQADNQSVIYNGAAQLYNINNIQWSASSSYSKKWRVTNGEWKDIESFDDSLTDVGTHSYEFGIFDGDDCKASDTADFTVTKKPITVQVKTASKSYDGTPLYATILQPSLCTGHNDVVTYTPQYIGPNVTATSLVNCTIKINSGTQDVTSNYDITYKSGTLTITKKSASITTSSKSKDYDGTALTSLDVNTSGFIAGEGVTVTVTGSQTDVGSSSNTFTYTAQADTKLTNYNITENAGTLTVNQLVEYSIDGGKSWSKCSTTLAGSGMLEYNINTSNADATYYVVGKVQSANQFQIRTHNGYTIDRLWDWSNGWSESTSNGTKPVFLNNNLAESVGNDSQTIYKYNALNAAGEYIPGTAKPITFTVKK